jgi:hypothetical protein
MVGRPMGAPVVAARGEARHRPLRPCGSWVSRRPQALALGRARPPLGQHAVPPAALAAHGLGDAAGPEGAGAAPRAEGGPLARARGRGHPVPPERVLRAPRDLVCLHGVRRRRGGHASRWWRWGTCGAPRPGRRRRLPTAPGWETRRPCPSRGSRASRNAWRALMGTEAGGGASRPSRP